MAVLVVAEPSGDGLSAGTLSTITAATRLGRDVDILVAGHSCRATADAAAKVPGVARVRLVDADAYAHPLAETLAPLVVREADGYSHVLAPASTTGKNLMPRVASLLDVAQISEITAVIDPDTFERPIYAGNAIETVQSADSVKVITVRTTAFEAAAREGGNAGIEERPAAEPSTLSRFVEQELSTSERPELTAAKIVVAGGRGLGSEDNFQMLERLADALGAAIGATRAAVDSGFIANDYQIGQTGKIIAPQLYIGVGISGAIQHLAGMKDSKVIVAINKDEDAPIFQVADYGLVADLFTAVPELIDALENKS